VLALLIGGLSLGGCSFSYQLGSLFGKDGDDTTGAVPARPQRVAALDKGFSDSDLAIASQAASAVLARGEKGASAPWQNPATGARGTVTPLAADYEQDGFTCREFLASYVKDAEETWMQGEACRAHQGHWVVRSMKPWKRA